MNISLGEEICTELNSQGYDFTYQTIDPSKLPPRLDNQPRDWSDLHNTIVLISNNCILCFAGNKEGKNRWIPIKFSMNFSERRSRELGNVNYRLKYSSTTFYW